jgi:hypothetical protein
MLLLANRFALGSLAGGVVVAILSCLVIRDAETWFPMLCAGYGVAGCITAAIYAPILKFLAFGRREITRDDGKRAFITAAVCAVAQYLCSVVARTHEYDRTLLFTLPFVAALLDAARVRMHTTPFEQTEIPE